MNETLRIIDRRMSLRRYQNRDITPQDRGRILKSALRAPTAGNMMLYSIIEVADPASKARLAETCRHPFIEESPFVLLFLADLQRWFDYFEAHDVSGYCEREKLPFRTPGASDLLMSCCDALIAAQNSVIAAESLGVGSCYVGDIMGHAEVHQELFALPPWVFPITLLCYGYYPDDLTRRRTTRFEERFICFRDRYKRLTAQESEEMLAGVEAQFADALEKRGLSLAEMTYRSYTASAPRLEEARSVRQYLRAWQGTREGSSAD